MRVAEVVEVVLVLVVELFSGRVMIPFWKIEKE